MDFLLYKFLAPFSLGAIILSMSLAVKYFKERLSKNVLMYQISALGFIVFNYLEFISYELETMILYAKFQHVMIMSLAISWFFFALKYTGYDWLVGKRNRIVILQLIITFSILVFTNDYHFLFWEQIDITVKGDGSEILGVYGPLFWIITALDYILFWAGIAFITVAYIKGGSLVKNQAVIIVIAFFLPLIANFLYIFRVIPGFNKDFSSVAFGFTSMFLFFSIYRFRLLHFSPVARNIVLHNLDEVVITLDTMEKVIDYNTKAADVFDLNELVLGSLVYDTELGPFIGDRVSDIYEDGEIGFIKEYNGAHYDICIKKIKTTTSSFKAILISMSDITQRVKLYNELEESNRKLQEIHLQLVQKEKMAALGQLSAGVAHEINNPLSFIKSNFSYMDNYWSKIEDLCERTDSENCGTLKEYLNTLREVVDDSRDGVNRIAEVVKHLLGYSRDQHGDRDRVYNINEGIESTLVLARNSIKYNSKVNLKLGEVETIQTVGNEINQVLLNLITNALQSIPNESMGVIDIETYMETNSIICEISDTGEPIEHEVAERIFEPFYTTKGRGMGTGLGLSLSRSIIEEYNGKLYLKESEKKTFRIELPIE